MTDATVLERIKQDITDNQVVLFMKGTPVFPQCGFSAAVVQILTHLGVKFKGIDVLADPSIRQGIKDFSSWPTIPQLYVDGKFVGGCDIVKEMHQTGELAKVLGVTPTTAAAAAPTAAGPITLKVNEDAAKAILEALAMRGGTARATWSPADVSASFDPALRACSG